MNPYVKSVKPQDDYCLLLTFENGEKRIFDLKPYFDKPVFARLKNIALFKTVRVVSGIYLLCPLLEMVFCGLHYSY